MGSSFGLFVAAITNQGSTHLFGPLLPAQQDPGGAPRIRVKPLDKALEALGKWNAIDEWNNVPSKILGRGAPGASAAASQAGAGDGSPSMGKSLPGRRSLRGKRSSWDSGVFSSG